MSRKHQGCSRIAQNHFSNHFVNIHVHQGQGHGHEPRTILQNFPSDEIAYARTIEISRSGSPPNLRLEIGEGKVKNSDLFGRLGV